MKKPRFSSIKEFNSQQTGEYKEICETLYTLINSTLPKAESKIWYGAPVWFRDENPLVGYNIRKAGVTVLFWSGQSFDESGLDNEGKFKAAQKIYKTMRDINTEDLRRWLKKSYVIMWDYKNIVKNRGKLSLLKLDETN